MLTRNVFVGLAPEFLSVMVVIGISFYINYVLATILMGGLFMYVIVLLRVVKPKRACFGKHQLKD